jgi:hypothetical protein
VNHRVVDGRKQYFTIIAETFAEQTPERRDETLASLLSRLSAIELHDASQADLVLRVQSYSS